MTPNPFAPPRAEVANPLSSQPGSPRAVRRACWLVVLSMFLGMALLVPGVAAPSADDATVPFFITLAVAAFFGGLTIWLAVAVARGTSWARWALLAYLALGWVLSGLQFTDEFLRSPVAGMIEVVCVAMEFAACGMLFFGSGAAWFSELARLRAGRRNAA
ncbi:MAG: hypothetical protein ABI330_11880 [Caldimonas sp.]